MCTVYLKLDLRVLIGVDCLHLYRPFIVLSFSLALLYITYTYHTGCLYQVKVSDCIILRPPNPVSSRTFRRGMIEFGGRGNLSHDTEYIYI